MILWHVNALNFAKNNNVTQNVNHPNLQPLNGLNLMQPSTHKCLFSLYSLYPKIKLLPCKPSHLTIHKYLDLTYYFPRNTFKYKTFFTFPSYLHRTKFNAFLVCVQPFTIPTSLSIIISSKFTISIPTHEPSPTCTSHSPNNGNNYPSCLNHITLLLLPLLYMPSLRSPIFKSPI